MSLLCRDPHIRLASMRRPTAVSSRAGCGWLRGLCLDRLAPSVIVALVWRLLWRLRLRGRGRGGIRALVCLLLRRLRLPRRSRSVIVALVGLLLRRLRLPALHIGVVVALAWLLSRRRGLLAHHPRAVVPLIQLLLRRLRLPLCGRCVPIALAGLLWRRRGLPGWGRVVVRSLWANQYQGQLGAPPHQACEAPEYLSGRAAAWQALCAARSGGWNRRSASCKGQSSPPLG